MLAPAPAGAVSRGHQRRERAQRAPSASRRSSRTPAARSRAGRRRSCRRARRPARTRSRGRRRRPAPQRSPSSRAERAEVVVGVDVQLEHVGRLGQALGRALGHPPHAPEAGQHDLGALSLRALGDRVGDRVAVDDAGDEDPLAVEDHKQHLLARRARLARQRRGRASAGAARHDARPAPSRGRPRGRPGSSTRQRERRPARARRRAARASSTSARPGSCRRS